MNEQRFEPEEFERLLALPEGHPERMSAERSGRLLAWKQMLEGFESPPDELFSPQELARAEAELAARVELAVARVPVRARPAPRDASWLAGLLTGGRRVVLAVAAIAVVAAAGWWSVDRLRERPAVRGSGTAQSIELRSQPTAGGIELSWTPVVGATMYRLVFFGPDLSAQARVDSLVATRFTLRSDRLPAGLARGRTVRVEVAAVLPYDTFASKSISIALP